MGQVQVMIYALPLSAEAHGTLHPSGPCLTVPHETQAMKPLLQYQFALTPYFSGGFVGR